MKIGLSAYDIHAAEFLELAGAADEAGFDSLWLGEHVVLPIGFTTAHPTSSTPQHHSGPIVDPDTELVDPLVLLGAAAAVTSHIRLVTGIYILPLRHPLAIARSTCTVHEISAGRFSLGAGVGWLVEEFAALDQPFEERSSRFEETIDVLRAAWKGGAVDHAGPHFSISGVQVTKHPAEIPVILGGNTNRALQRAVRLGDGWFSSGTPSFDDAVRLADELRSIREENGATGEFETIVRVEGCDPAALRRYEDAGFEHVVIWADQVWPGGETREQQREALFAAADRLGRR